MYSVGLILKSSRLLAKLTALHVWGEDTGFEIEAVCGSLNALRELLRENRFDLLIVENDLVAAEDYQALKELKNNRSCNHIALCSTEADFESARKGILLGLDDYFALPFQREQLLALFDRIREDTDRVQSSVEDLNDTLMDLFLRHEKFIYEYLEHLYRINAMQQVIDHVVAVIFDQNEWLDLYLNEDDFLSEHNPSPLVQRDKFLFLFESYAALYPKHGETLDAVIAYILYNPESDLRQKTLSEGLHINKSYLSTIFIAQTNIRFVDYITNIKLMRAAWFLKNTDLKISEIANRMDYRDVAYFSKQFKKTFKITPSEYRIPDDYHFDI